MMSEQFNKGVEKYTCIVWKDNNLIKVARVKVPFLNSFCIYKKSAVTYSATTGIVYYRGEGFDRVWHKDVLLKVRNIKLK